MVERLAPSSVPELDEEVRGRLRRRFGATVEPWFDGLPAVLADLAGRWAIEWGPLVRRGSMSVVIRCRAAGRQAVLKVAPERMRLADEAAALARWTTAHVPELLAVDEAVGALLLEAIAPGTPVADAAEHPGAEAVGALMRALHGAGGPSSFPPLTARVVHLFDSGLKPYERRPELREVIPPELYERGRRLALRLAADPTPRVLLHGDLTPANTLDGGRERGLVAIDPAPCVGDPAFDAIDFVLWRADDVATIEARAEQLAAGIGADAGRLHDWCAAFAAMVALEVAEGGGSAEPLLELAARA